MGISKEELKTKSKENDFILAHFSPHYIFNLIKFAILTKRS